MWADILRCHYVTHNGKSNAHSPYGQPVHHCQIKTVHIQCGQQIHRYMSWQVKYAHLECQNLYRQWHIKCEIHCSPTEKTCAKTCRNVHFFPRYTQFFFHFFLSSKETCTVSQVSFYKYSLLFHLILVTGPLLIGHSVTSRDELLDR